MDSFVKLVTYGPCRDKTFLGVSDKASSNESPQLQRLARKLKIARSNLRYDTFQKPNNKGADQTIRLVCAFVIHKPRRQVFLY